MITSPVTVPVHQMCRVRLLCPVMDDADQTLAWGRQEKRKGRKDESCTDRQQPGGQDGQPRLSETFHHTGEQLIPHRDLKEDVAGTCGCGWNETALERQKNYGSEKLTAQLVPVLALCAKKVNGGEGETKKDSWCLQWSVTKFGSVPGLGQSAERCVRKPWLLHGWIIPLNIPCSLLLLRERIKIQMLTEISLLLFIWIFLLFTIFSTGLWTLTPCTCTCLLIFPQRPFGSTVCGWKGWRT